MTWGVGAVWGTVQLGEAVVSPCTVMSDASWIIVRWNPTTVDRITDRQKQPKTLPSRNVVDRW